jgi:hypothetical protein
MKYVKQSLSYDFETILDAIYFKIRSFLNNPQIESKNFVYKIFLPNFHQIIARYSNKNNISVDYVHNSKFFLKLKHLIRDKNCILAVSVAPNSIPTNMCNKYFQFADNFVSIDSFTSRLHTIPYEFKDFSGFLNVLKIQQQFCIAPFRPRYDRYGLKRDRRKLHIEPLHLPPEESRATSSAASTSTSNLNLNNKANVNNSVNSNSINSFESQISLNLNSTSNINVFSKNKNASNENILNSSNIYNAKNMLEINDDYETKMLNPKHNSSCISSTHHSHSHARNNATSENNDVLKPKKMTPLAVSLAALKASRLVEKNKQPIVDSSSVENKIDW